MTWKEFIAEIISSIAWPIVAILFLALFKTEMAKIIMRLAHFKYKDFELDFDRITQQAEEIQKEQADVPVVKSPVELSLENQILSAVETAPSAAILLAWSGIETAMASAVARMAISPESPSYRSPKHNIDMLIKNGGLAGDYSPMLNNMRRLRNEVAHGQDSGLSTSHEQASRYANVAIDIIQHLETLKKPI